MAAFGSGSIYPGSNQPAWWTTTTTASTNPIFVFQETGAAEKPKRKTNLDWLRARVDEVCALAELGV